MFKTADSTRRIPVYLQANTKENLVWQLKLTAVLLVGTIVVEEIRDRRWHKKMSQETN